MTPNRWIAIGALLGAAGVALGAFGAHGLEGLANHETAVRYQMWHALAIVVVGIVLGIRPSPWWNAAGWAFLAGVVIFSGLLYVLVLAGPSWRWLGAIVPIGGLSLIAGWILLAAGALRQ
jgi:uncharacterized membrane protein YgdD (TMEM256/DUF423 family)